MGLFAPPVRDYDGRKTLRSLADALEKLRELNGLAADESAVIRTMGMRLLDGRLTSTVAVVGPKRSNGRLAIIRMPSAAKFTARTKLGERQTYYVPLLDEALSDAEGNVRLQNGQSLKQVDFIPTPAHYQLTPREEAIILAAVAHLKSLEECFPEVYKDSVPGLRRLRFDAIAKLRVESLKTVLHFVNERLRDHITLSVLAKTLARAGMQLPRSNRQ